MRNLPILSSFSIIAIILAHANWHVLSVFTNGDIAGMPFVFLDQLCKFSVSAFVFIGGYFAAYAANTTNPNVIWKVIIERIKNMLWPWIIWSIAMTVFLSYKGSQINLENLIRNLFIQYYFAPLLITFTLLAPFMISWAKTNTRNFIIGSLLIEILGVVLFYIRTYDPNLMGSFSPIIDLGPFVYVRYTLFFSLGLIYGLYPQRTKEKIERFKGFFPFLIIFTLGLSIVETTIAFSIGGSVWPIGGDSTKFSSVLYALFFILWFICLNRLSLPYQQIFYKIGNKTYGIYLSHYIVIGILNRLLRMVLPWKDFWGIVSVLLQVVFTVVIVIGFMNLISKLPTRRIYKYIFS